MKYTIFKNGLSIMTGNPDMCSELEKHKEAKGPLEMMGFPTACPIPQVGDEFKLLKLLNFNISFTECRDENALIVLKNLMLQNLKNT